MFERKTDELLSRADFLRRMLRSLALCGCVIAFSLGFGSAGYHAFGGLDWLDAMLNASMILTGMGPVDAMTTKASKLFASAYALYSGIVFLSTAAVLLWNGSGTTTTPHGIPASGCSSRSFMDS